MRAMDHLALVLRDLPPLHRSEKRVTFDPVQMTFLQKLVRESALQGGVTLRKDDFFKGLVFADTFMELLAARATLWDDVRVIVDELEKIHPYLDVDLGLLVRYSGIYLAKELRGEALFKPASIAQIQKRHERANARAEHTSPAPPDLFDRAVARFAEDMLAHARIRNVMGRLDARADLRAAFLADAILAVVPESNLPAAAKDALDAAEMGKALPELFRALLDFCKDLSLKDYVASMAPA
jgi:hypothetical protein